MHVHVGASHSDADNLGPHLIKAAQLAYAECCIIEHNKSKTKAVKHVCKAVANTSGALHVHASTASWSHKSLCEWDFLLIMQASFWCLHTKAFLAKWHASESGACSLCGLTSDTGWEAILILPSIQG